MTARRTESGRNVGPGTFGQRRHVRNRLPGRKDDVIGPIDEILAQRRQRTPSLRSPLYTEPTIDHAPGMNGVVALLTIVDRFGRDAVDTRQFDVSTLQLTIRAR